VLSGPPNSGELTTPTGAALARILSAGPPPAAYTPVANGFGAGTKEFADRANALRIVLADATEDAPMDGVERLVELVADIDDMPAEYLAAAADRLRDAGARDVVLLSVQMKRGRPGTRLEVLAETGAAAALEALILNETSTIGVRRREVLRRALPRERITVDVLGYSIHVKVVRLPGGERRVKPEFVDVDRAALASGRPSQDIFRLAVNAACSA
jgi:uncharacterized protein (DUF111 family)